RAARRSGRTRSPADNLRQGGSAQGWHIRPGAVNARSAARGTCPWIGRRPTDRRLPQPPARTTTGSTRSRGQRITLMRRTRVFGRVGGQDMNERFVTGTEGLGKVVVEGQAYPRGASWVVLITFGAYIVGLVVFGLRWLRRRPRRRSSAAARG